MPSNTIFSDLHSSLLKFSTEMAEKISAITGVPVEGVFLDAYADDETMPSGDFVGLTGLSVESDGNMLDGSFMIGFAVQTDKNLFRMVKGINEIFYALTPGNQVKVISAENGFIIGGLGITEGTRVMPVGGKAGRPVQLVVANFQTPSTFRLQH